MTIPQPAAVPAPPPEPPPPPKHVPEQGSRLEYLLDQLETAKARLRDAEGAVEAIKAGIRAELTLLYPQVPVIDIAAGAHRPGYRLRWCVNRNLDRDKLRTRYLDVYNDCLVWGKGFWQLDKVKS